MKRVILSATEGKSTYYHYDMRRFNKGETISGDRYEADTEVLAAYKEKTELNCSEVLYMLPSPDDEYFDTYRYEYEVYCTAAKAVFMDYSYLMCLDAENSCKREFNKIAEPFNRSEYIELMSSAYIGNNEAKRILFEKYGYSISDKIEYIADSATVQTVRINHEVK